MKLFVTNAVNISHKLQTIILIYKGVARSAEWRELKRKQCGVGKNVKEKGLDNNLLELIAADPAFNLSLDELRKTMDPSRYVGRSPKQVEEFLEEVIKPLLEENAGELGVTAEINV